MPLFHGMKPKVTRRRFVQTTAGFGALAGSTIVGRSQAPQVLVRSGRRPVVVSSANGNKHRDPDGLTCVEKAFAMITRGADVLEAVVEGVTILERTPDDTSVGYGGLPNADGVVQLDSCVMHGPKKSAGGVAALEGVRTPARVALKVMQHTDHHLLVGQGAQDFARMMGFPIEPDLNTDRSRALWLEWKRRIDPRHYLDPEKRTAEAHRAGEQMVADGLIDPEHYYGTINCNAVNARGEVCGVTTTSGLAWKIPGRVGDSPILGAGLYVDGEVGAAGSTGRGEANLFGLCSFLIVESLRQGMAPVDAGMVALKRVVANTIEKRLLNDRGRPNFGLNFYVVNRQGAHAGLSLYPSRYAVCTEDGSETRATESLFDGGPREN